VFAQAAHVLPFVGSVAGQGRGGAAAFVMSCQAPPVHAKTDGMQRSPYEH
jgi:hypothetical protein